VILIIVEDGLQADSLRAMIIIGDCLIFVHQFCHIPIDFLEQRNKV
jgi:hypothetical protein